ncbi:hypothetical protein A2U01_0026150 [Trifolium medium]|uniref:Uncharacterized protein n=1 Tax=Trifolium medium TaxID=97028 RepID=A0A392P0R0_9FABA|nr:hypothetical protein [Trifolium medium]
MEETGPSRPGGKGATASVRRAKEKALEERGVARSVGVWLGNSLRLSHMVTLSLWLSHNMMLVPMAEAQPDPAPATEEDDGVPMAEAQPDPAPAA